MHKENLLKGRCIHLLKVGQHLLVIGMTTQAVNLLDMSLEVIHIAENLNLFLPVLYTPSQCIFCHIANQKDGVPLVTHIVHKVVQDTARFAHSRCRDNHGRTFKLIQLLGFLYAVHIPYIVETEGVVVMLGECLVSLLVVALLVQFVD